MDGTSGNFIAGSIIGLAYREGIPSRPTWSAVNGGSTTTVNPGCVLPAVRSTTQLAGWTNAQGVAAPALAPMWQYVPAFSTVPLNTPSPYVIPTYTWNANNAQTNNAATPTGVAMNATGVTALGVNYDQADVNIIRSFAGLIRPVRSVVRVKLLGAISPLIPNTIPQGSIFFGLSNLDGALNAGGENNDDYAGAAPPDCFPKFDGGQGSNDATNVTAYVGGPGTAISAVALARLARTGRIMQIPIGDMITKGETSFAYTVPPSAESRIPQNLEAYTFEDLYGPSTAETGNAASGLDRELFVFLDGCKNLRFEVQFETSWEWAQSASAGLGTTSTSTAPPGGLDAGMCMPPTPHAPTMDAIAAAAQRASYPGASTAGASPWKMLADAGYGAAAAVGRGAARFAEEATPYAMGALANRMARWSLGPTASARGYGRLT